MPHQLFSERQCEHAIEIFNAGSAAPWEYLVPESGGIYY